MKRMTAERDQASMPPLQHGCCGGHGYTGCRMHALAGWLSALGARLGAGHAGHTGHTGRWAPGACVSTSTAGYI